eukprot:TRINITY_DN14928_c0_g1_i2.p1 TRINITY_DN14928_c0_g1~~TRINITY_DN14928_c0_g1_i2.p1  ORF type:complete len:301 (+),score=47.45 TRINITY_DN14928_c0_g1_i2:124-903(+)
MGCVAATGAGGADEAMDQGWTVPDSVPRTPPRPGSSPSSAPAALRPQAAASPLPADSAGAAAALEALEAVAARGSSRIPACGRGCELVHVRLVRQPGVLLGFSITDDCLSGGVLITDVNEKGLLATWNAENPLKAVRAGDVIVGANGSCGTFDNVLQELYATDVVELYVSNKTRSWWFANSDRFMQRERLWIGGLTERLRGDAEDEQCCICLDNMMPGTDVVNLPCKHKFHPVCAARWFALKSKFHGKCRPLASRNPSR